METSQPAGSDTQSAPTNILSVMSPGWLHSWWSAATQARPGSGFFLGEEAGVPRKEVIQPHLPVQLPCYDFTPITNPTLDACPSSSNEEELAQRLQVLPTFVV